MTRYAFAVGLLSTLFIAAPVQAQSPIYDPTGLWLTQNERSVVELFECQSNPGKLCGSIHWIIDGGMQFDEKNPKPEMRNNPLCGMGILSGLSQNPQNLNEWENGNVYKADDGDVYDADLKMKDANNLTLRGYMGVSLFGKSQDWTRVSAADYPRCKAPKQ